MTYTKLTPEQVQLQACITAVSLGTDLDMQRANIMRYVSKSHRENMEVGYKNKYNATLREYLKANALTNGTCPQAAASAVPNLPRTYITQ